MRQYNRLLNASVVFLLLMPPNLQAEDKKDTQPSEDFLEFLAAMSKVDGELSDPLDMLEINNDELIESEKLVKKNDMHKVNQKIVKKVVEPAVHVQEKKQ